MTRVGITPPPVTITADDRRLKNGKPFPDPFLLAAKELGYDCKQCVVFEDSPSGIKAGVASGAIVVAVWYVHSVAQMRSGLINVNSTSHERSKIMNCGAHYVIDDMDKIRCTVVNDRLQFTIAP